MASEYLKKKYQDVKPDVPRELTREERWKNWWDYHKWHVVIGAVLLLAAADLVWSVMGRGRPHPDYQIAYVGSGVLPDDTAAAVEAAFAALGEDLNGDGQVLVTLRQYCSNSEEDPSATAAVSVQLMADVTAQESFFFLLEDPARFQQTYHSLSHVDGTLPEEDDDSVEDSVLLWGQCPVLAGMDLGDFNYDLFGGTFSGSSQELLSRLYIARRGLWEEEKTPLQTGWIALWEKLTEGAVSQDP